MDGANIYAALNSGLNTSTDAGANFSGYTVNHGLGSSNLSSVYVSGGKVYVGTFDSGLSISL